MALNKALFSSDKEDWATPQEFFDSLNEEFHFNLDPCADPENAKCDRFFTKEENGLLKDWGELRFLQSAIRQEDNGRMDRKVLQRSTKREYDRCCAYTGTYRYKVFSRLHIRESGNPVHKGPVKIRQQQRRRTVPVNGNYF